MQFSASQINAEMKIWRGIPSIKSEIFHEILDLSHFPVNKLTEYEKAKNVSDARNFPLYNSRLPKAHFWHLSKLVNLKPLTVVIYKS